MGYQVILDVIASTVVGALLFLIILSFHAKNMENKRNFSSEIRAFSSISSTMEVINDDFNRIGYCSNRFNLVTPFITSANATSITFRTDTITGKNSKGNGTVDLISYRLGNLNTSTPCPNDRFLEKSINGGSWYVISPDVTEFTLRYFRYNKDNFNDSLNTPVGTLNSITRVGLKISVVNSNATYSASKLDSVITFKSSLSFELR